MQMIAEIWDDIGNWSEKTNFVYICGGNQMKNRVGRCVGQWATLSSSPTLSLFCRNRFIPHRPLRHFHSGPFTSPTHAEQLPHVWMPATHVVPVATDTQVWTVNKNGKQSAFNHTSSFELCLILYFHLQYLRRSSKNVHTRCMSTT